MVQPDVQLHLSKVNGTRMPSGPQALQATPPTSIYTI